MMLALVDEISVSHDHKYEMCTADAAMPNRKRHPGFSLAPIT